MKHTLQSKVRVVKPGDIYPSTIEAGETVTGELARICASVDVAPAASDAPPPAATTEPTPTAPSTFAPETSAAPSETTDASKKPAKPETKAAAAK